MSQTIIVNPVIADAIEQSTKIFKEIPPVFTGGLEITREEGVTGSILNLSSNHPALRLATTFFKKTNDIASPLIEAIKAKSRERGF